MRGFWTLDKLFIILRRLCTVYIYLTDLDIAVSAGGTSAVWCIWLVIKHHLASVQPQ